MWTNSFKDLRLISFFYWVFTNTYILNSIPMFYFILFYNNQKSKTP